MLNETNLSEEQKKGVNFILEKKKCALFFEMGVGKTITSLTVIPKLIEQNKIRKTLIVSNKAIVKSGWHSEIEKWEHTKHLTYSICVGTATQRFKAMEKDVDVYITNNENLLWMLNNDYHKFGFIIVDEASNFRNGTIVKKGTKISNKGVRFQSILKFKYNYMVLLTGTPTPNNYHNLWSQIYLLDRGERLGKNISEFRKRYFRTETMVINGLNIYNYICTHPEKLLDDIDDIIYVVRNKTGSLPKITYVNTYVESSDLSEFKKLKDPKRKSKYEDDVTISSAAVLSNKLLQYCNGFLYNDVGGVINIHNKKLEKLQELVNSKYKDENLVVTYKYKQDLVNLLRYFPDAEVFSEDVKDDWNAGNIKMLLVQPSSQSKGLNLQNGGHVIIWFGLTYNLEDYIQMNCRLHRQGQTNDVIIDHIITEDLLIEEKVLDILNGKNINQNKLFEYLIK